MSAKTVMYAEKLPDPATLDDLPDLVVMPAKWWRGARLYKPGTVWKRTGARLSSGEWMDVVYIVNPSALYAGAKYGYLGIDSDGYVYEGAYDWVRVNRFDSKGW